MKDRDGNILEVGDRIQWMGHGSVHNLLGVVTGAENVLWDNGTSLRAKPTRQWELDVRLVKKAIKDYATIEW